MINLVFFKCAVYDHLLNQLVFYLMINQFGNFGMTLVIQYILCYDLSVNIYWIKTREIKRSPTP